MKIDRQPDSKSSARKQLSIFKITIWAYSSYNKKDMFNEMYAFVINIVEKI